VKRERSDWKLDRMLEDGIADCGLRIADCGLRIYTTFNLDFASVVERIHKSAIRNPQSAIQLPILLFLEDHGIFRLLAVS
jgi:hypothetical protein